ncbi:MAG: ABC transporter permease [Candidatus Cryptobacteroides sp.]
MYNFAHSPDKRGSRGMNVSFYIASRLKFKGRLAVVCITVSFLVMILAVSISSGFRNGIRDALSAISGDVQITPVDMNYLDESSPIVRDAPYVGRIESLPEVDAVCPAIYRAGIIKSGANIHGVLFKGISDVGADSLGALGVSIPSTLASKLEVGEGDHIPAYFIGSRTKVRKFLVRSIYEPVIQSDDKLIVYASLEDMQRLNGWNEDQVSVQEVFLKAGARKSGTMEAVADEIGYILFSEMSDPSYDGPTVVSTPATKKYPQIFDWLNLIDFNVLFILILMTVVAGFNMISGLLIMLFENISTIGVLKSLGMTDRKIAGVFLSAASSLVLKGMAYGNLAALSLCLVQKCTHIIKLNPVNYFVPYVPVHIDVGLILAADAVSYAVIMLFMLLPSLFISKVDPAKTVSMN